eukprot:TRINITY_DN3642_c0_g1_i1.p3 TRINITY_DN3642_c0_g1~~TRINITY_DN3642_c0_g1_i1.p3  ORF type:complete len:150 (-),score=40.24 TRINITY_DN3642_c0_g1_i1:916-1365(-)
MERSEESYNLPDVEYYFDLERYRAIWFSEPETAPAFDEWVGQMDFERLFSFYANFNAFNSRLAKFDLKSYIHGAKFRYKYSEYMGNYISFEKKKADSLDNLVTCLKKDDCSKDEKCRVDCVKESVEALRKTIEEQQVEFDELTKRLELL